MLIRKQLCNEIRSLDSLQCLASRHSQSSPLPSTCPSCPCRSLHRRHDGKYRLCRRHCQAGEVPLDRWPTSCWCCYCRSFWPCASRHSCDRHTDIDVDGKYLALWWLGGVWRLYAIRHAEGFAPC